MANLFSTAALHDRSRFSYRERELLINDCQHLSEPFDLCIIGGGITGAAIARDAVLRGLGVLLVEKGDFGSGTSSRSSKLVHGGVRYLEQYEFKLVMESTRERARLWKLAPELVTPIPFLFPAYKGDRVPLWKLNAGLWLYDILSFFRSPTMHKKYSAAKVHSAEPTLNRKGLEGAIFYWDGATDDARLTLANITDAYRAGAHTLAKVRCDGVNWNLASSDSPDHAHTVRLVDELTGKNFEARARVVVSATGPWTDEFLGTALRSPHEQKLATTRGSHVVVSARRLPAQHAIVLFHPKDQRVLFVIPWGESTIIGTTDIFDQASPDKTHITRDEVQYLLDAANDYYPDAHLKAEDIVSVWTGLRPLLAPPSDASASEISREHVIEWDDRGFALIAGGKLTTHREMAEQLVEKVYEHTYRWNAPLTSYRATRTKSRPLPRLEFPRPINDSGERLGLSVASNMTLDDVRAVLRYQCVLSLEDFMVRRTSLFYKEPHNGWQVLPKLKEVFMIELEWTEAKWQSECQAYRQYLEASHLKILERQLPEISV